MGNDDQLKDGRPLAEPSAGADENVSVSPHGQDGHASMDVDAAAVAALQQLGTDANPTPDVTGDLASLGDHDLVAALHVVDVASNIDQALDQLTHSADLFDMPALDFGDHSDASHS
jgi:hypothetical protein